MNARTLVEAESPKAFIKRAGVKITPIENHETVVVRCPGNKWDGCLGTVLARGAYTLYLVGFGHGEVEHYKADQIVRARPFAEAESPKQFIMRSSLRIRPDWKETGRKKGRYPTAKATVCFQNRVRPLQTFQLVQLAYERGLWGVYARQDACFIGSKEFSAPNHEVAIRMAFEIADRLFSRAGLATDE
jgi:hypothetical protein